MLYGSGGSGRSSKKSYDDKEFSENLTEEDKKNLLSTHFAIYMEVSDLKSLLKKSGKDKTE